MNRLSPAETRQKEGADAHDSGPNRWECSLAAGWRRPVSALPAVSRECRVSVNRGEVRVGPEEPAPTGPSIAETIVTIRHVEYMIDREDDRNTCVLREGRDRFFGDLNGHRDKSYGSVSGLGETLNLLFALPRDKFGRDPDCVMATAAGIYGKVKYCPPSLPPCQSDWLPDDRGNRTLVFIW